MPENNTYSFDIGENWFSVAGDVDDFIFYGTEEQEKYPPSDKRPENFFRKWCRNGVNFRSFLRH